MDRSILGVFLATILVISHVSRYTQVSVDVFIAGLYLWHPSCFPHAVAAALTVTHQSVLPATAASLLGLSDRAEGEWRHLHGPR